MKPLSIGITCYPSIGGSGIVATEVGLAMARRGHQVHFICSEEPVRLTPHKNVHIHTPNALDYPVFPTVPYSLALCSKMVEVTQTRGLDILHAHYAVPHAVSAWMAREVLQDSVKVVTTLHGTDITLVGSDPSYLPITRHSIMQSDAVTVPSEFLRTETWERFGLSKEDRPIEVIPNFVDVNRFHPLAQRASRLRQWFDNDNPVVVHVSNFRPLKRVDRVVEAFLRADVPANLLLIGEGPTREAVLRQARSLGSRVAAVGALTDLEAVLRECAVFVLPSETESFGLAALEALASGVPVIASDVGGLPEVVRPGVTGFLEADVDGLTARLRQVLTDPEQRRRMGKAAVEDVRERFQQTPVIDEYEAVYRAVLAGQ